MPGKRRRSQEHESRPCRLCHIPFLLHDLEAHENKQHYHRCRAGYMVEGVPLRCRRRFWLIAQLRDHEANDDHRILTVVGESQASSVEHVTCPICKLDYTTMEMESHIVQPHNHTCQKKIPKLRGEPSECRALFTDPSHLQKHNETHYMNLDEGFWVSEASSSRGTKCHICYIEVLTTALESHMREDHRHKCRFWFQQGEKFLQCPGKFVSKENRLHHQHEYHPHDE